MSHLTAEQIERYASRSGNVDEILEIAQHFEACADCRDRAAALIDSDEDSGARHAPKKGVSGPRPVFDPQKSPFALWIVVFAIVIAAVIAFALLR